MPIKKDDQTQTGPAAGAPVADPADELTGTITPDQAAELAEAGAGAAQAAAERSEAIKALAETTTPEEFSEAIHDAAAIATATKKGIAEALAAATSTMEVVKKMTDNAVRVSKQAAQIYNHIQPVSAAIMEGMREVTTAVLDFAERWQARQDDFYNSGKWDKLQQAFPEVTQDTAMPILFVGLMDDVLEHADAIKRKMAEYEADTGTALDFNDLTELEGGAAYETLLEAFIAEAQEEAGQEIEGPDVLTLAPEPQAPEVRQLPAIGIPKYFIGETSQLFSAIMNRDGAGEVINAGAQSIPVLNIDKSDEITVFADLRNDMDLPGEKPGQVFPKYKREYYGGIYGAVNTLYWDRIKAGVLPIVTPDMIYRTMTHKTDTECISPKNLEAARFCMEYWRHTDGYIDATDELIERQKKRPGGPKIEEFKHGGAMIAADPIRVKAGGVLKEGYLLLRPPLLSLYSETVSNQRITVKGKVLDIKEVDKAGKVTTVTIPATENRIAINFYMLRRVAVMREDEANARELFRKYKNGCRKRKEEPTKTLKDFRKVSRTILINTVFKAAEIPKKSQYNAREYILNVLKYWRAMDYTGGKGFIKDFNARRKGKTTDAAIIEVW